MNEGDDDDNNIRVCVRIRPMNAVETERGDTTTCTALHDGRSIRMMHFAESRRKWEAQTLKLDKVFGPETSQIDVFHQSGVESFCDAAADGFACTVFCFGQTGSGKTFTMTGPINEAELTEDNIAVSNQGLQFRALHYFAKLQEESKAASPDGRPTLIVKAAMYEIYNEQVNDLLNETTNLKVRWAQTQQAFFVESLMLVQCDGLEDMLAVLQQGLSNRKRCAHLMNQDSSRSHVILSLGFERQSNDGAPPKLGKMNLVDLAGSEKLKDSGSVGVNATETKNINQSLLALGKVITALAARSNEAFVPYRDSTLTRLLMDSLGGNAKTLMLACVTPSSRYAEESIKTIKYAVRASTIVNMAPTVRVDPRRLEVFELRSEIDMLKKENALLKEKLAAYQQGGIAPVRLPSLAPTPEYGHATPPSTAGGGGAVNNTRPEPKYRPPFAHGAQQQQPQFIPQQSFEQSQQTAGYAARHSQLHQQHQQHAFQPQGVPPPQLNPSALTSPYSVNGGGAGGGGQQQQTQQWALQQAQHFSQHQQQHPMQHQQHSMVQPVLPSENELLRQEVAQLRNMILESRAHAVAASSPTRKTAQQQQQQAPFSSSSPQPHRQDGVTSGQPTSHSVEPSPAAAPTIATTALGPEYGFRPAPKKSQRLGFLQALQPTPLDAMEGTTMSAPAVHQQLHGLTPSATIHSVASAPPAFAPRQEIDSEVSRMNRQLEMAQRELASFRHASNGVQNQQQTASSPKTVGGGGKQPAAAGGGGMSSPPAAARQSRR